MTLINASLIAGAIFAGLPVLLHMIMKAKPKRIEFPALKLLQSRQTSNSRRMRIRHLLLLTLRSLVLLLAVFALARPSLPAARYGLRWYEWLLLLTVVVVAVTVYWWRDRSIRRSAAVSHVLHERRSTWKVVSLLGSLLAVLLVVGVPYGLRVRGEMTAPVNAMAAELPVAAVFLFDTSPSMTYKQEGRTRLENAARIALDHLRVLPNQSRVAVATTSPESEPVFQADLAGVRSRVEGLRIDQIPRSLNATLKAAIEQQVDDRTLVQQQTAGTDAFVREIYLLTDSSVSGWQQPDEAGLRDLLVQYDWLQVYVIDVGIDQPANIALTNLKLDTESTVAGQPVTVSFAVSGTPAARKDAVVELYTLDESGEQIRGGGVIGSPRRSVSIDQTAPLISFLVKGKPGADFTSGVVRISSPDPMTFDDTRYFSFRVADVPRILLVAEDANSANIVRNVLDPQVAGLQAFERYDVTFTTTRNFSRYSPSSFDIVCILNWTNPPDAAWSDLLAWVRSGGQLFLSAGGDTLLQTGAWITSDSEQLLPGLPLLPVRFRPQPARLILNASGHPIVNAFEGMQAAKTELNRAIFDRCWTFEPIDDARTVISFSQSGTRPALMERSVGRGRVMLFSSALDNNSSDIWNESFVNGENWAFLVLIDEVMRYLSGAAETKHNFTVGDPVELPVTSADRFAQYIVARPRLRQTRGQRNLEDPFVLITDASEAGHYSVDAADDGETYQSVFTMNVPDSESDLTRMTDEQLNEVLGDERFVRVTDLEQLDRAVNLGRLGVEVFPVLLGLLMMLFCGEHLMANYFYDEQPEQT